MMAGLPLQAGAASCQRYWNPTSPLWIDIVRSCVAMLRGSGRSLRERSATLSSDVGNVAAHRSNKLEHPNDVVSIAFGSVPEPSQSREAARKWLCGVVPLQHICNPLMNGQRGSTMISKTSTAMSREGCKGWRCVSPSQHKRTSLFPT